MSFRINDDWPAEYAAKHTGDKARDKRRDRLAAERRVRRERAGDAVHSKGRKAVNV